MRTKFLLVGSVAAGLLAAASAVSANASVGAPHSSPLLHGSVSGAGKLQANGSVKGAAQPSYPCFYQGPDGTGNGIVSTDYASPNQSLSSTGADDFSVSAPCLANQVTAWGQYAQGGAATQVEVAFYYDSGGLPGGLVAAPTITSTFSDSAGFLTIPLATPVSLLANTTYWVSVQAQNVTNNDAWYWDTATIQGNPAVWQNPGNAFGTGCTTWTPLLTCTGVNADFAFFISAAGASPCYSQTASSYPMVPVNSQDWTNSSGKKDLAADDFTLPGYCKLHSVVVPFRYLKSGTIAALNVTICPNTGPPFPPSSGCWNRTAVPVNNGLTMKVSWSSPIALVPGSYWIEIRALGASTWGLWGWDTIPQVGLPAVWRNGGWWNASCPSPAWWNLAGCNPGADHDLAFTLYN